MNALKWIGGVLGAAVLVGWIGVSMYQGGYDKRVRLRQAGVAQLQQVQNVQQRQFELLPNLTTIAREFTDYQRTAYVEVNKARAEASKVTMNVDVSKLAGDPAALQKLIDAQNSFAGAMSRFIAVTESQPNLKGDEQYLKLHDEFAGSANRIAVERRRYIGIAQDYNGLLLTFWNDFFYKGKFQELAEFKASAEATQPFRLEPRKQ